MSVGRQFPQSVILSGIVGLPRTDDGVSNKVLRRRGVSSMQVLRGIWVAAKRAMQRVIAAMPTSRWRKCIVCNRRIGGFLPYRGGRKNAAPLMRHLNVIGSDIDNFECPRCGAHDRERHLLLYLRASGIWDKLAGLRILHFAPERHLSTLIAAQAPAKYMRCDLHPASEDIHRVDIEQMPFPAASQDLVIANHVLEHVINDRRAIAEIFRVLAPGGMAILQTPYSAVLEKTWSDPGITDGSARFHAYGQEDHVRLFGRDIFGRFAESGLVACIETHEHLLPDLDPVQHGVNRSEPFFLYRRVD